MNYYRDPVTSEVYAYDDQQVEEGYVKEGLVPMTPEEVELHLNPVYATPLPADPDVTLANPTIDEWNALCSAAGVPELFK